jgi:hypothetical protein
LQPVLLAEFSGLAKRRGLERQNRLTVDFQHEDGRRWRVGLSEAPLPRLVEAPLAKLGRPSGQSALAFRTFLTRGGCIAHLIDLSQGKLLCARGSSSNVRRIEVRS